MPGTVICCANNKGGIGKTCLACHLAVGLAKNQQRVLVIDNDAQCNATSMLLPTNTLIRRSLYELYEQNPSDSGDMPTSVYPSKYQGLYCIPNVEQTSGLELELASSYPDSLLTLRNAVRDFAVSEFDYTIIDCPPTLSLFVANALYASDFTIVPIDAGSAYSLDGLRKVLELISSVQASGNPDLNTFRLLINRVDKRTAISRIILDDIRQRFSEGQVLNTTIPVNTAFQQAEYANETVFRYHATSRGAKAYRALAREVMDVAQHQRINHAKKKFGGQNS
ncbi:MAG: ParA family protein [Desulfatibacillaceae bacterium]